MGAALESMLAVMETREQERIEQLLEDAIKYKVDNATDYNKNIFEMENTQRLHFIDQRSRHLQDPTFTFQRLGVNSDGDNDILTYSNNAASIHQMTLDEEIVALK